MLWTLLPYIGAYSQINIINNTLKFISSILIHAFKNLLKFSCLRIHMIYAYAYDHMHGNVWVIDKFMSLTIRKQFLCLQYLCFAVDKVKFWRNQISLSISSGTVNTYTPCWRICWTKSTWESGWPLVSYELRVVWRSFDEYSDHWYPRRQHMSLRSLY